jgi:hypothetical protein
VVGEKTILFAEQMKRGRKSEHFEGKKTDWMEK